MTDLFEIKDVDRAFYAERLRDWLPERIVDIHTHVWRDADRVHEPETNKRTVSWPALVAREWGSRGTRDLRRCMRYVLQSLPDAE